jgi:hypothetical protein
VPEHRVAADRFVFDELRRERLPIGKFVFGGLVRRNARSEWRSGLRTGSSVRRGRHKQFREKTEANEGGCMLRRPMGGSNERGAPLASFEKSPASRVGPRIFDPR